MINSVIKTAPHFINFEIIIIDDNSTDDTYDICKELKKYQSSLKVYRNTGTGKVAGSIFGLTKVTKKWIKCIDGDDFVDLSFLEEEFFNCDAFYHDYYRYEKNKCLKYVKTSNSLARRPGAWNYNLRSIPKGMFFFQKSVIDHEDIHNFNRFDYEDAFINFIIAKNAISIKKINKAFYFYRQHEENFYGDSKFGEEKVLRIRARLLANYSILTQLYPEYPFNNKILIYCDTLEKIKFFNILKLLLSPQLLLKALVYRVYARF